MLFTMDDIRELNKRKEQEALAAEQPAPEQAPTKDSLLAPSAPVAPFQQLKDNHGTGGAIMRLLGTGLSGGLLGGVLAPEIGRASQDAYAGDLELYNKYRESALPNPKVENYISVLMDPNSTHTERMAAAARAGGVNKVDPNPITASPGASILGAGTGEVLHSQPHKPVPPPAAVAEATATARAKGIDTNSPIFGDLIAAYAEPTETRTNPADGSTYSVNTVQEVLQRHAQEQQAQQQQVIQPQPQQGQPQPQPQRQDPNTLGPVLTGINEEQALMVTEAPEKLKFYRRFGEIINELGKWDPNKGEDGEFVLNEDTTDLYGSWQGNVWNPQNWGSEGRDAGGFNGANEWFMPQGNRDAKAGVEQMIESLAVDERGKLKGQGQITEGETAMLRAAVTRAAKRGMGDKAAQREYTRLYKEYLKAMELQQNMLERYWPNNPVLTEGSGSDIDDSIIDLDAQGQ